MFPYINLCKKCGPRTGPFLAHGHYLNKLGRGPLGNIKTLGLVVSDKKFFHVILYKPVLNM